MKYHAILTEMHDRHALGARHALEVFQTAIPGIGRRIARGPQLIGSAGNRMAWDEKEDATENLHGSAFVVLQGEITATVGFVERLHDVDPNVALTTTARDKKSVVAFDRERFVYAIDTAANYFKHRDEWGPDWSLADGRGKKTADAAREIGLRPEARENLTELTLRLTGGRLLDLEDMVYEWRRNLVSAYARELEAAGKLTA